MAITGFLHAATQPFSAVHQISLGHLAALIRNLKKCQSACTHMNCARKQDEKP
jgi:hypothetical protein